MKKLFLMMCLPVVFALSCAMPEEKTLAEKPPMGWNSFDSYGVYLHEDAAMANLEAFVKKLKPYGYEYFVIDAGWFAEVMPPEGTLCPGEKHKGKLNMNEYGFLQPSKTYFPHGLQRIIDRCHESGLKFGLHLMRGIPKQAAYANLPVKGTGFHAWDIADTVHTCVWSSQNYGIDMSKPGAQEFYDGLVRQMADWGVDFIKYDDIVPFPAEVQAVAEAIRKCGRPILLSLSPGGRARKELLDTYRKANMLRVTSDIWDDQKGIDRCFKAWREWQGTAGDHFWIDMDMIPFGQLKMMSPMPAGLKGRESKAEFLAMQKAGKVDADARFSGSGYHRWSLLDKDQMKTFIVLRAMAASPLMVGGDLPSMDDYSLSLLTDKEVLACNQNGVMGSLCHDSDSVEVWKTPSGSRSGAGWLGIFNRSNETKEMEYDLSEIGLEPTGVYELFDVFAKQSIHELKFSIPARGVVFMKYAEK